jgi:multiple sugar transport system ATP-binding protein
MTMGHRIAVLNAGRLQQLGTPMELYQWPANLFVAQFIGSPPMNLLPVQAVGSAQVQLGSRKLAVEGPLAEALAARTGQELTGGLRPEHFQLAPATNRNLKAEVSHGEALGNEQLLTCRLEEGGHLVQVRVGPEVSLPPGASLHLDVDPRGWRLFDRAGDALPPSRPRAAPPELKLP